ncbi:MAG: cbb3-type cytochrome c oxidase subunit I [Actinobacteria bacterium]|nr:cbb3-type cytochrome c oxidase subunit I [Actinomycetota bacterium]
MFSRAPDSAARQFIYSSAFWLVLGATCLALASVKLVAPDFLHTRLLSYPRLTAVGSISLIYGWLTLAGLAAIFYAVPRLTGARVASEAGSQLAGMIINLTLAIGVAINLFGGVQDQQFSELPSYLDAALVFGLLIATANVWRSVSKRVEPRLYISIYFFLGGLLWAMLGLAVGNLHALNGVPDEIAHLFSINTTILLWVSSVGAGALYYVVPRASGAPLHSHRLAVLGFWSLAIAAPLSGSTRQVYGPSPEWLVTISIASSILLVMPVLALLVNLFGTLRVAWDRVADHPSIRFFVAGSAFWSAGVLLTILVGFRGTAKTFGATDWETAPVWIIVLGGATLWALGFITFALPRLMGRRWIHRSRVSSGLWLTAVGVAAAATGWLGAGATSAIAWMAGSSEAPSVVGAGYEVVLESAGGFRALSVVGLVLFAIGQWIFALHMIRTTAEGEPHPVEVVTPVEALL